MQKKDYDIKLIFQEIEDKLISSMKRNLAYHKQDEKTEGFDWGQWQAHKLKSMQKFREENKEIFNEYSDFINRHSYKSIKSQFKEGASKVNKEAIKSGFIKKEDSQLGGSFFKINNRKIKSLVNVVKDDMKDVKTATLRFMNDTYRSTIYKAQIYAGTGAGTLQQAIDMATHDFLKKGINCIEYKDGRRINIADYCDMAVKTAQTRATLMGEGALRQNLGISTVYVTKHGTACEKCSKWEGRVYIDDVWSGGTKKDGKYPLLSTAIAGGLYHPRCRHGISTYFEGINDEPKEIKENEYNHDDKYIQALNRRKREYERLALGSLLPENVLNYKNKVNELQKEIDKSKITEEDLLNKIELDINEYNPDKNIIQEQVSKILEMDQLPIIVNKNDFEKYDGVEISRFLRDYKNITAEGAYKNTLYGKIRYSDKKNSQYGRGIYFGEKADFEELNYTYGNGKGKVINAKISKSAKILEFDSVIDYIRDVSKRTKKLPEELQKIYDNERSLLYMLDGYDGIKINKKNYYCIYNRKVLIINDGE